MTLQITIHFQFYFPLVILFVEVHLMSWWITSTHVVISVVILPIRIQNVIDSITVWKAASRCHCVLVFYSIAMHEKRFYGGPGKSKKVSESIEVTYLRDRAKRIHNIIRTCLNASQSLMCLYLIHYSWKELEM